MIFFKLNFSVSFFTNFPLYFFYRKRDKIVTSKRKFADFTMVQETHAMTTNVEINTIEDAFMIKSDEELPETLLSDAPNDIQTTSIIPKSPEQNLGGTISLSESPINSETNSLTAANITTTATATTAITTKITESIENLYDCNVIESPVESVSLIKQSQDDVSNDVLMDTTLPIEQIKHTPATEISPLVIDSPALVTPTTPSVPKERKRRIIIDDDDESPTFNPQRSNKKLRGKNRRNKHNLMLKKQKKAALLLSTPSSSTSFIDKANENAVFTSPEVLVSISEYHIISILENIVTIITGLSSPFLRDIHFHTSSLHRKEITSIFSMCIVFCTF